MNVFAWIGGGAAALVAVVAALYFAGFGGVVRAVGAVTGAIGDGAQWLRAWLRKPGNKTRGVCLVLAVVAMSLGMQSWQRGTVIIQQRADYTALKAKSKADLKTAADQVAARDRTIQKFTDLAAKQKLLLEQAARENQAAVEQMRRAQAEAAKSEAKYQAAFDARPPECEAALQVMAKACPTLKDY